MSILFHRIEMKIQVYFFFTESPTIDLIILRWERLGNLGNHPQEGRLDKRALEVWQPTNFTFSTWKIQSWWQIYKTVSWYNHHKRDAVWATAADLIQPSLCASIYYWQLTDSVVLFSYLSKVQNVSEYFIIINRAHFHLYYYSCKLYN